MTAPAPPEALCLRLTELERSLLRRSLRRFAVQVCLSPEEEERVKDLRHRLLNKAPGEGPREGSEPSALAAINGVRV